MFRTPNIPIIFAILILSVPIRAQDQQKPELACITVTETIRVDGLLNEEGWSRAGSISTLMMVEPHQGMAASYPTRVSILADQKNIYLCGIFF